MFRRTLFQSSLAPMVLVGGAITVTAAADCLRRKDNGYHPTGCGEQGGQYCFCKSVVRSAGSGKKLIEWSNCVPCDVTPPSGE